jgi:hypothetical protein
VKRLWLSLPLLALPALAAAQDRATEFVAVSGPAHESVPGGALLVTAYAFVWLVVLGIVLRIALVQAKTGKDLARLEKAIADRVSKEGGEKSP